MTAYPGPESGIGPSCTKVAAGVWVTSGRAAVLEGDSDLAVVDPGDEPCGTADRPSGPLADLLEILGRLRKPLEWVLVTHAHPDHIANLGAFRALGPAKLVAHARSPLAPEVPISCETRLPAGGGLVALPTPGHAQAGDDVSYWLPRERVLLPGDLVQPKGESWDRTFYPSPWVYFTDGERYAASLERLRALPFEILITGHREVRTGPAAHSWVDLTLRSIRRIEQAVAAWDGPDDLAAAAPEIYRRIARERGLSTQAVEARLAAAPGQPSAFERFDLPGIAYYWQRREPPEPRAKGAP